jgi:hypothetical protein
LLSSSNEDCLILDSHQVSTSTSSLIHSIFFSFVATTGTISFNVIHLVSSKKQLRTHSGKFQQPTIVTHIIFFSTWFVCRSTLFQLAVQAQSDVRAGFAMRLRQTIRAPSRYEDECELSTGVSPRRLPRRRKAAAAEEERAMPYIDYNPNHPPAAFPTLDHPLPAGQTVHSLTSTSTSAAAAANADLEADGHHLDAFNSFFRGIPPGKLDNFIASNGPQNPQYRRNMALLAREDDDFDLRISDDDDELQPPDNEGADEQWVHREVRAIFSNLPCAIAIVHVNISLSL